MRLLSKRPPLPAAIRRRLGAEQSAAASHSVPPSEAIRRYTSARTAKWFQPAVRLLEKMSGSAALCWYCDGNEGCQIDHYWPKQPHWQRALDWENFMWTCALCNHNKLAKFPVRPDGSPLLLNPASCDPWDYFFMVRGHLIPVWDPVRDGFNESAEETIQVLALTREHLQTRRQRRWQELHRNAKDTRKLLSLRRISPEEVKRRIKSWRDAPFQMDVADYYLRGPGSKESTFATLFREAGIEVPSHR